MAQETDAQERARKHKVGMKTLYVIGGGILLLMAISHFTKPAKK